MTQTQADELKHYRSRYLNPELSQDQRDEAYKALRAIIEELVASKDYCLYTRYAQWFQTEDGRDAIMFSLDFTVSE